MLTVIFGNASNSIYNTSVYFKNTYELEWLESELAKEIIKDIDKPEVLRGIDPCSVQIPKRNGTGVAGNERCIQGNRRK